MEGRRDRDVGREGEREERKKERECVCVRERRGSTYEVLVSASLPILEAERSFFSLFSFLRSFFLLLLLSGKESEEKEEEEGGGGGGEVEREREGMRRKRREREREREDVRKRVGEGNNKKWVLTVKKVKCELTCHVCPSWRRSRNKDHSY